MKNKTIAFLTSVAMTAICLGGGLSEITEKLNLTNEPIVAEAATYGDLTYYTTDTGIIITDCDESATSIEIPNKIDGLLVTSIGEYAFADCSNLISITIPDSVTNIIGSICFNCTKLKSIEVSGNNSSYTSIDGVLFDKKKTTLIQYPIGNERTKYDIPYGVTHIQGYAFANCSNLTSTIIPDSVKRIGIFAFSGCKNLENITVPGDLSIDSIDIGSHAFYDCQIKELIISNGSKTIRGNTGVFGHNIEGNSVETVVIPDSVTNIGDWAFFNFVNLENIELPNNLKNIGAYAFSNCTSLTDITIPDSVTGVSVALFYGCSSLKDVTLSNNIISLSDITDTSTQKKYGYFEGCTSLESIVFPNSITGFGKNTFKDCTNLDSLTINNPLCEIYADEYAIPTNATIYGHEGSVAQEYAEIYNRNFVSLGEPPEIQKGDTNGDNKINLYDAIEVCEYIMNMKTLTDFAKTIYDYDANNMIDLYDAIGIAKELLI